MKVKNNQLKIKAALALGLLAPVLGEILTGSSPPLTFFRPVYFLFLVSMYGCGVLLIRDLVRVRRLGWVNIAILGSAYGLIEEGLIITSFYNPQWGGVLPLAGKGVFLGINLIWALYSVFVHVVLTVFSSIVLVESLFPQIASQAWLSGKQRLFCGLGFLLAFVFGYHFFVNILYPAYTPPVFSYLLIAVFALLVMAVGMRLGPISLFEKTASISHPYHYFGAGFTAMLLLIVSPYALTKIPMPILVILTLIAAFINATGLVIVWWTGRWGGWTPRDRLALASGMMMPWLGRMFLLELGLMAGVRQMNMSGMAIAAIIIMVIIFKGFKKPTNLSRH